MPDTDDLFDGNEDENLDGDSGGSEQNSDSGAQDQSQDPPKPSDSKRINDLMSKWQAAEAKATRLETELARNKTQGGGRNGGGSPAPKPGDEWIEFQRQMVREQLYNSEPRFKAYGIEPDAISGQTPQEMKAAFDRQRGLVEKIETAARNAVLQEHGLVPELIAGTAEAEDLPDFARMSSKEFEEYNRRLGF